MNIPIDINKFIEEKERSSWVTQYPELKAYEDGLKSMRSKTRCIKDMIRYCRIVVKNPTELCNLGTTRDDKIMEGAKLLKAYCNLIENWNIVGYPSKRECPLKYTMAWNIAKSVRGFYRENLLDLPKAVGKLKAPKISEKRVYTPQKEDLRKLREEMKTYRDKVIIHWVSSIPLRRNEHLGILWNDLDLSEEYPYIILSSERLKGNYTNVWFVGIIPKSLKEDLKKLKEEQKKLFKEKGLEWNELVPIFTEWERLGENEEITLSFSELGRIIRIATKKLIKKYGIDISLQDMRRYYENRLDYAESQGVAIPSNYREWFLGHKLKGSKPHYNIVKDSIPQIIEVFKKIEPFTDIDYSEASIKQTMLKKWNQLETQGKTKEEIIEEMYGEIKGMMSLITSKALTEEQKRVEKEASE